MCGQLNGDSEPLSAGVQELSRIDTSKDKVGLNKLFVLTLCLKVF